MAECLGLTIFFAVLCFSQHAGAAAAATAPASQVFRATFAPPVPPPPRLFERMADLTVSHGYPLEEHFVETVDGYILRLFRIPHGREQPESTAELIPSHQQQQQFAAAAAGHGQQPSQVGLLRLAWRVVKSALMRFNKPQNNAAAHRPVVHFQHGLLGSSTDFVLNGPGLSLPLLLADAGYDVWFGNVRGNIFSRNHSTLDLLDPLFWAFSWDEMAARDLPAMLTRELLLSGASQLSYVGHSQGTTIGMAFLASHAGSELVNRIDVAVLLAPVAFVTHVDSIPLMTLATLNTDEIFILLGFHEFLPSSEVMSKLEGQLCKFQPALCVNLLAAICGYNPNNLDTSRLPVYLNYTPSGTSVKNMAHWSQAVRQARPDAMRYFDYGTTCRTILDLPQPCNQAVYGQLEAPEYNLSAIGNKLVLFTGGKDRLGDPTDTLLLLNTLPRRMVSFWQHEPGYEHLDFIWGINAATKIYANVLQILDRTRHVSLSSPTDTQV